MRIVIYDATWKLSVWFLTSKDIWQKVSKDYIC